MQRYRPRIAFKVILQIFMAIILENCFLWPYYDDDDDMSSISIELLHAFMWLNWLVLWW